MTKGLSLLARDEADLATIAACLQDALVPLSEVRFEPSEQRFYMIANRFQWERAGESAAERDRAAKPSGDAAFASSDEPMGDGRRNAAVRVDQVLSVRSRGIDFDQSGKFLSLLTIQLDGPHLNLIFAGGGVIQLEIKELALLLRDLGTAWPTQWRPSHDPRQPGKG